MSRALLFAALVSALPLAGAPQTPPRVLHITVTLVDSEHGPDVGMDHEAGERAQRGDQLVPEAGEFLASRARLG